MNPPTLTDMPCVWNEPTHLDSKVVSGEDVATPMAKLDIGDGGNDLWEEGPGTGVFRFLKYCMENRGRGEGEGGGKGDGEEDEEG